MNFMSIVKQICNTESTDCRSLNKINLARQLMDLMHVPTEAEIEEIPLDWCNQVGICFLLPNDNNYYSLYAGKWNDESESIYLSIIGKLCKDGEFDVFDFWSEEKILPDDYFATIIDHGTQTENTTQYEKYIVWYKTRSGKYTREIPFKSYDKALSLYNVLERDFKYLIGVDENGNHHALLFIN